VKSSAFNLAVSLHAVTDEPARRDRAAEPQIPIAELIAACARYPGASNARRITFEYVMLRGINDSEAEARALVKLLAGLPAESEPDPLQPLAGSGLPNEHTRSPQKIRRHRDGRRLRLADPHATWARYSGGMRAVEECPGDSKKRPTPVKLTEACPSTYHLATRRLPVFKLG